jgi:cysteine sulfinate desulfinase
MAKAHNALTVVDGAQGVVHGRHDVQALGCDFYVFSSHKLYAPMAWACCSGAMKPCSSFATGSSAARWCWTPTTTTRFRPAPLGFEAGTPPIASVIGLGASLDYLAGLDQDAVSAHEAALHDYLLQRP